MTTQSYSLLLIPNFNQPDERVPDYEQTLQQCSAKTTLDDFKEPGTYWFDNNQQTDGQIMQPHDFLNKCFEKTEPQLRVGDCLTIVVAMGSGAVLHGTHPGKFENLKIVVDDSDIEPQWCDVWADIRDNYDVVETDTQCRKQKWAYSGMNYAEHSDCEGYKSFTHGVEFRNRCRFYLKDAFAGDGDFGIFVKFGDPHKGKAKIRCKRP